SEGLASNSTRTFSGRIGWEGVGQAKAVLFIILVAIVSLIQNKITTSKEVDALCRRNQSTEHCVRSSSR
ncbi:hypothetical protein DD702_09225, partial [Bifidobacterium animalis subsp. lactis]